MKKLVKEVEFYDFDTLQLAQEFQQLAGAIFARLRVQFLARNCRFYEFGEVDRFSKHTLTFAAEQESHQEDQRLPAAN